MSFICVTLAQPPSSPFPIFLSLTLPPLPSPPFLSTPASPLTPLHCPLRNWFQLNQLSKTLDVYEKHLEGREYLANDKISLADLSHISWTEVMIRTEYRELLNSRPNVKAWWDRITSRLSIAKVWERFPFNPPKTTQPAAEASA